MTQPHKAMLWEPAPGDDQSVNCKLCGHHCHIPEGEFGRCSVRQNVGGELFSRSYDRIIAMNVDPIEKKPLFHFLPGSRSLSIAAPGCNFRCGFCQNWQISQPKLDAVGEDRIGQAVPPEEIVDLAAQHGCASISYTYTEPTIFFELAYDTAKIASERGIRNCFVSNGFMTPEAVDTVAPVLDAINVDLKAFSDKTYREVCGGRLDPVRECLRRLVEAGVWVEVTTLVVPGMNDSREELQQIAQYIAGELGPHVPWHVSRFHGDYEMPDHPVTPMETLELACELGREAGLRHVYCGNVSGLADERTYCPACQELCVDRRGFSVGEVRLKKGACPSCREPIAGVWE
jgi:pyruvate formate lyase activating enzyme